MRVKKEPKTIVKVMYYLGIFKVYHNGDGYGVIGRYWNPLFWLQFIVLFFISTLLSGAIETWKEKHDLGLGIDPWFKEHPEELEYWFPGQEKKGNM